MRIHIGDEVGWLGRNASWFSLDALISQLQQFQSQCDPETGSYPEVSLDIVNGRLMLSGWRNATEEEIAESQREMFEIDGEICDECGRRYDDEGY